MTYAALESTLLAYIKRDYGALPAVKMMQLNPDEIRTRAKALAERVQNPTLRTELRDGESVIGGGSAPSTVLPTALIALTSSTRSADALCSDLRQGDPPVITRVEEGQVMLDLRTVFPEQDEVVLRALQALN